MYVFHSIQVLGSGIVRTTVQLMQLYYYSSGLKLILACVTLLDGQNTCKVVAQVLTDLAIMRYYWKTMDQKGMKDLYHHEKSH